MEMNKEVTNETDCRSQEYLIAYMKRTLGYAIKSSVIAFIITLVTHMVTWVLIAKDIYDFRLLRESPWTGIVVIIMASISIFSLSRTTAIRIRAARFNEYDTINRVADIDKNEAARRDVLEALLLQKTMTELLLILPIVSVVIWQAIYNFMVPKIISSIIVTAWIIVFSMLVWNRMATNNIINSLALDDDEMTEMDELVSVLVKSNNIDDDEDEDGKSNSYAGDHCTVAPLKSDDNDDYEDCAKEPMAKVCQ